MSAYKYHISGLDCANCAAKVERAIAGMDSVSEAHVDFINKTLTIKTEHSIEELLPHVKSMIDRVEDGIQLTPAEEKKSAEQAEEKEEKRERIELVISLALLLLGVAASLLAFPLYLEIIFYGLSAAVAGYRVCISGLKSILRLRFDENALMTIAVIAAFFLGDYFEAAMVALLFHIGEMLEDRAVNKSRHSIEELAEIRPDTAWILHDNGEQKVDAQSVAIGSVISVHPFERVPLDGVVLSGSSTLDASALTGESLPVEAGAGTEVLSGMMNGEAALTVKVTKAYSDSAATRIIDMVESAAAQKGNAERAITRFARVYTPIVMVLAILLAFLPPLAGMGDFSTWISRALVFLVASCPCALVISVPLGFYSGIGAASKIGVLVKGGRYLEALSKVDAVVFDKTGTLTSGKLSVSNITTVEEGAEDAFLRLAAAAEQYSEHPVARAIKEAAAGLKLPELTGFTELAGLGVRALHDKDEILCGRNLLFEERGISLSGLPEASVYLSVNGKAIGAVQIADAPRKETPAAIQALRNLGIKRLVMLTGDAEKPASEIARQCGLTEYHAGLMPEDKVRLMQEIRQKSGVTAFVGDGINDAPVLAAADCGIAMGLGTDAAIESADIVLTTDSPARLPDAISLFRRTMGIVRFNIALALIIKAVVLILAAFGYAPMWSAVFADVGVSLIAVLNSTRILKMKRQENIG